MHHKKYNIIFCSEIGQKHIGAETQKEIIQVLKDETPHLIYKYPWTQIIIISGYDELIYIEPYGYREQITKLKSLNKFLKSKQWQKLWIQWCY